MVGWRCACGDSIASTTKEALTGLLVLVAGLGLGALFVAHELPPTLERLRTWEPASGEVVAGRVTRLEREGRDDRYRGELRARVVRDGVALDVWLRKDDSSRGSTYERTAQRFVQAHPPGTPLQLYVHGEDPTRARFDVYPEPLIVSILLLLAVAACFGVDSLAEALAAHREHRALHRTPAEVPPNFDHREAVARPRWRGPRLPALVKLGAGALWVVSLVAASVSLPWLLAIAALYGLALHGLWTLSQELLLERALRGAALVLDRDTPFSPGAQYAHELRCPRPAPALRARLQLREERRAEDGVWAGRAVVDQQQPVTRLDDGGLLLRVALPLDASRPVWRPHERLRWTLQLSVPRGSAYLDLDFTPPAVATPPPVRFGPAAEAFAHTRDALRPPPRRIPFGLLVHPPRWLDSESSLRTLFADQKRLQRRGHLVWGHVVQAQRGIDEPGEHDLPGTVLYDPQGRPEALPALQQAAHRLSASSSDPYDRVSQALADDQTPLRGHPAPRWADPEGAFVLSDVMFIRQHLPSQRLCQRFVPLWVLPGCRSVWVLHHALWSPELRALWTDGPT